MELEDKFFLDSLILEKEEGISLVHLYDGNGMYIVLISLLPNGQIFPSTSGTWWCMMSSEVENVYKTTRFDGDKIEDRICRLP